MLNEEIKTKLKEEKKKWYEQILQKFLKKNVERKDKFTTGSELEEKPIYDPTDLEEESFDFLQMLGYPGAYPFTRGIYPNMYRGRLWTMRQYAGFGSAKESNARFKYLLSQGTKGLSVAFDLPTQMGIDSDDPRAIGEVGRVGVSINTLKDMEELFEGIPLGEVSTSMTINATAIIILAMYIKVAQKQGVSLDKIDGTVQNDILKEYIARGTYIFEPKAGMKLVGDLIEYCSKNLPKFNTISISGYHMREAGSNAYQEIAFTLANGLEYIDEMIKRRLSIDDFAPRLSFFFCAQSDFFEEIAKFRAARRLWAKLIKEKYNPKDERSLMLRFHTQTAGVSLTAQQPENNIVRVAYQALSAVLGGTQSLHTNSKDEALSIPTEESVTTALRTQQILAYETNVTDTVDPLGGSYFIEQITSSLEQKALEYIKKVESMGGMIHAINAGYIQREIADNAYKIQRQIETERKIVVGVNKFKETKPVKQKIFKLDTEKINAYITNLKQFKSARDMTQVKRALADLENDARSNKNIFEAILTAVESYCSIGEIVKVLEKIYGRYHEQTMF